MDIIRLAVWFTSPTGEKVLAGEIASEQPTAGNMGNSLSGQFRYHPDFLKFSGRFALDPLLLPLGQNPYNADRADGVHGIFEDSLPDSWGRSIIENENNLDSSMSRAPILLQLSSNWLGALSYGSKPPASFVNPSIDRLADLAEGAKKIESNDLGVNDAAWLCGVFNSLNSLGGSRPKILVCDGGKEMIAKFPSRMDQIDIEAVEAATMAMARDVGIQTPSWKLVRMGKQKALLIERFDINQAGGRNHLATMHTLLGASDPTGQRYSDMAVIVLRVSENPKKDLPLLFRQMVFNVAVANTDDHLKNFSMIRDQTGWRLSPAYDLVTNNLYTRNQSLLVNGKRYPGKEDLLAEAKNFALRQSQAADIIEEVWSVVEKRRSYYQESGVPAQDIKKIDEYIGDSVRLGKPVQKKRTTG
jgi:serine/threonine-protein kinase HipA